MEEAAGVEILADGFPAEMTDDEPEFPGWEVVPTGTNRTPMVAPPEGVE